MQDPTLEKIASWKSRIPAFGCRCTDEFAEIEGRIPVRYDDWPIWTFDVHNEVNIKLGKPTMAITDSLAIWRPDLLAEKQRRVALQKG